MAKLFRGALWDSRDHIVGGRIVNINPSARLRGNELIVDEVGRVLHGSQLVVVGLVDKGLELNIRFCHDFELRDGAKGVKENESGREDGDEMKTGGHHDQASAASDGPPLGAKAGYLPLQGDRGLHQTVPAPLLSTSWSLY